MRLQKNVLVNLRIAMALGWELRDAQMERTRRAHVWPPGEERNTPYRGSSLSKDIGEEQSSLGIADGQRQD